MPFHRIIDLENCPIGSFRFPVTSSRPLEHPHAPGWMDANNSAMFPGSLWRVGEERIGGEKFLEVWDKRNAEIITGELDWRDYTISAAVRQLVWHSRPGFDDEYMNIARTGLTFRRRDVRQHYWFCFEGQKKIVLYHRLDYQLTVLAEKDFIVDPHRYYTLRVTCEGNRLRCDVDGVNVFDLANEKIPAGHCGLRTNCPSRYRKIEAQYLSKNIAQINTMRDHAARELDALREQQPKPVLLHTVPLPSKETCLTWFGHFRSRDAWDILVIPRELQNHLVFKRLLAIDLNGRLLWERQVENPSVHGVKLHAFGGTTVADVDGDGLDEIITAFDEKIFVLRGRDGAVLRQAPMPAPGVYAPPQGSTWSAKPGNAMQYASIFPVQWKPKPAAKGFIVMEEYPSDGGNCAVALDENLHEMWRRYLLPINYGHTFEVWDVDGDGREEVFAGYSLLNADGEILWQIEGYESFDIERGARHPDVMIVGHFSGDDQPLQVVYAGGGEGLFFVDPKNGKIQMRHMQGHVQWAWAGKLRPDVPGLQIVTNTLHGNPGIICIYDSRGNLLTRFQPDNENSFTPVVNWSGDGQELLALTCNYKSLGLWDGWGRQVVGPFMSVDDFDQTYGGPIVRINVRAWDLLNLGRDQIIMGMFGQLRLYGAQQKANPANAYRTRRRTEVWPLVCYPV